MNIKKIYERELDMIPTELPVLVYPNKILHQKSEPITQFDDDENTHLTHLIGDLTLTMVNKQGIGISAPQIGILARIIIILAQQPDRQIPEPFALINPVITESEGEFEIEEGCLSVPGYFENRTRTKKVVVTFNDITGDTRVVEFHGIYAFAVQHEIDHLDGKLFIDNLSSLKKKFTVEKKIKNFLKNK